jgi:hypothetical protein
VETPGGLESRESSEKRRGEKYRREVEREVERIKVKVSVWVKVLDECGEGKERAMADTVIS